MIGFLLGSGLQARSFGTRPRPCSQAPVRGQWLALSGVELASRSSDGVSLAADASLAGERGARHFVVAVLERR